MTSAVEVWLRAHTILVYIFLYIPIIIVVVFSFNATERQVTTWQGFSLKWYGRVLADRQIQSALFNSLIVASSTAIRRRSSGRWRPSGCSGRRAGSAARSPG